MRLDFTASYTNDIGGAIVLVLTIAMKGYTNGLGVVPKTIVSIRMFHSSKLSSTTSTSSV